LSKDWPADVRQFQVEVLGNRTPGKPYIPSNAVIDLWISLIDEEVVKETLPILEICKSVSLDTKMLAELADGIVDSIVVLLGTAEVFGLDIHPIWDAVQEANMAKKDGPVRADGKKLKPVGWTHPDIESIIQEQMK
jgi:hypothetical protein